MDNFVSVPNGFIGGIIALGSYLIFTRFKTDQNKIDFENHKADFQNYKKETDAKFDKITSLIECIVKANNEQIVNAKLSEQRFDFFERTLLKIEKFIDTLR
jgi:hypothetical protein